jgi:hypothetical protein
MPYNHYSCDNCGNWQEYFAIPPACPVCSDVRNALPENGWSFTSADEMREREQKGEITCSWRQIDEDVWAFSNAPQIGIGSSGYLIVRETGNIAFEAAGWYTTDALKFIQTLGGIKILSASHPHGFGALWQLEREFQPQFVAFQREAVQFTKAFNVNFVFDDALEIDDDAKLLHVGGHYEGQSVLYYAPRKMLFSGDTLKFDLDDSGKTVGLSCHKAFHKQIPLSRKEIKKYWEVLSSVDFTQVCTPFEHTPDARTADALRLFEAQLDGARTFTAPIKIERENYESTGSTNSKGLGNSSPNISASNSAARGF